MSWSTRTSHTNGIESQSNFQNSRGNQLESRRDFHGNQIESQNDQNSHENQVGSHSDFQHFHGNQIESHSDFQKRDDQVVTNQGQSRIHVWIQLIACILTLLLCTTVLIMQSIYFVRSQEHHSQLCHIENDRMTSDDIKHMSCVENVVQHTVECHSKGLNGCHENMYRLLYACQPGSM